MYLVALRVTDWISLASITDNSNIRVTSLVLGTTVSSGLRLELQDLVFLVKCLKARSSWHNWYFAVFRYLNPVNSESTRANTYTPGLNISCIVSVSISVCRNLSYSMWYCPSISLGVVGPAHNKMVQFQNPMQHYEITRYASCYLTIL